MKILISVCITLCCFQWATAQQDKPSNRPITYPDSSNDSQLDFDEITINGEIVKVMIVDGDTLMLSEFQEISVTSKRKFNSSAEYRKYLIYRKYAREVYPYAVEAIQTFKTVNEVTQDIGYWKKKKYVRRVQEQLFSKFEDNFKNLTKTQGRILIHMIEKELDTPMYLLIKDTRGWVTANYWQVLSGMFDYDLKEGYVVGKDPILDLVLNDFDLKFNEK
ncbi:DUF4294 domain-containing protein [Membranihabitans marinus]|uniref:DUF4294 domain-containing protein n=1 Tax=Membranihabitans marinus TaxID=1227546 RepID=UPI001F363EE7|nr:DUF4294 domain-containing protein [Membranihabitans marinus]